MSCVSRLNHIFDLQLNHHDINFMNSLCGNIRSDYYLKPRDMRVRLISCLTDSNRNSVGEFIWVSGYRFADELPGPFSLHDIGRYREPSFALSLHLLICCSRTVLISLFCWFATESKRFQPNLRVVHVRDLNFVLKLEIFFHTDGYLWASYLILGVDPIYSTWQAFS